VATKRRDLRSARSVWQGRRAPHVAHARLLRDIKVDVLVIGAGITGAAIADALALVDMRHTGRAGKPGGTKRSSA
jgi:NADPH-dependent 2,4-dienoyl-CoA reductase/sulfur reductase-like enzyme